MIFVFQSDGTHSDSTLTLLPLHLPSTWTKSIHRLPLLPGDRLKARLHVGHSKQTWALPSGNSCWAGLDTHQINNDKCDRCYKAVWDVADVVRTVYISMCSIFLNCLPPYFSNRPSRPLKRGQKLYVDSKIQPSEVAFTCISFSSLSEWVLLESSFILYLITWYPSWEANLLKVFLCIQTLG